MQTPLLRKTELAAWAQKHLRAATYVVSDGLSCFASVTTVGCTHEAIVTSSGPASVNHEAFTPERRHCSRNPKWGPSDIGCKKLGDSHGLRRPAFVLRPSRHALHEAPGLPQ